MATVTVFFAYNSGTVIQTGMKCDTDVPRVVPATILQERTHLSYIMAAILENGGHYFLFCS
jgi:hypothetical protein